MSEMIGTLDERTLHAQLNLKDLGPLANAYWSMTAYSVRPSQFASRFGEEKGIVQIFFPGPVVEYERVDGHYAIRIFRNGGSEVQAQRLYTQLEPFKVGK